MGWFIPIALVIGLAGTQTARHARKNIKRDRGWWLLVILAWMPSLCWTLTQFIAQD